MQELRRWEERYRSWVDSGLPAGTVRDVGRGWTRLDKASCRMQAKLTALQSLRIQPGIVDMESAFVCSSRNCERKVITT
jgi:hypothetical protein